MNTLNKGNIDKTHFTMQNYESIRSPLNYSLIEIPQSLSSQLTTDPQIDMSSTILIKIEIDISP